MCGGITNDTWGTAESILLFLSVFNFLGEHLPLCDQIMILLIDTRASTTRVTDLGSRLLKDKHNLISLQ